MTSHSSPHTIVIIGGVAGGASAAARARRHCEKSQIILIERGPDVSFANCGLPYHIGGEIPDRGELAIQTPDSLRALLQLDVRTQTEAMSIDRNAQTITVRHTMTGEQEQIQYDRLILSPGARPLAPALPGIDDPRVMTLRNLQDTDRIKLAAERAQHVLVIGGGFIGLEMAEQLVHLNKKVSLIERNPQVLPQLDREMARPLEHALESRGVELI